MEAEIREEVKQKEDFCGTTLGKVKEYVKGMAADSLFWRQTTSVAYMFFWVENWYPADQRSSLE